MKNVTWIKEKEAADMIGYKPATLRRYVKAARFDIAFTSINGRRFQYRKEDIEKLLLKNSTIIKDRKE